jgi:putative endonuclease
MLYTVYILFSAKYNKIYIGYTSNLINRFYSHNELSKKDWTRSFRPWIVIYCEYFEDKRQAGKREKELKVEKAENGFGIK